MTTTSSWKRRGMWYYGVCYWFSLLLLKPTHAFLAPLVPPVSTTRTARRQPTVVVVPPMETTLGTPRLSRHEHLRPFSRATSALSCQLLGMNCALPTEVSVTWPRFCERGGRTDIHADGWGLAYYQHNSLRQFHDVEPASTSPLAHFLVDAGIATCNLVAHIRYATTGAVELANVHPFSREMWGIQWCFCHNGQVPLFDDHPQYVLGQQPQQEHVNGQALPPQQQRIYSPVGTTDSEAAFCAILNALRAKFTDTMPSLPILCDELQSLCQEMVDYNPDETILNFMLTCGPHLLWVYSWPGKRPGSNVWNGVFYTLRDTSTDHEEELCIPRDTSNFKTKQNGEDDTYAVHFHAQQAVANGDSSNTATAFIPQVCGDSVAHQDSTTVSTSTSVCIVATKPLTKDEEWIELERGELLVLDEGIPLVSVVDLFRVELQGHGLSSSSSHTVLPPPRLEEDMRRYQFDPSFFRGGGI